MGAKLYTSLHMYTINLIMWAIDLIVYNDSFETNEYQRMHSDHASLLILEGINTQIPR